MLNRSQLVEALQRLDHNKVAERADVHVKTIQRLLNKADYMPRIDMAQKLSDAIKALSKPSKRTAKA